MVVGYQLIPSDSLSVVQRLLSLDVSTIRVLISLSFLFLFAFTMFTNMWYGMLGTAGFTLNTATVRRFIAWKVK